MFYAGLDLGQRRDHSALVVVERKETVQHFQKELEALLVRHVERMPLGTSYPQVVARVKEVVQGNELQGQCSLVVDGTGVGAPVVEMLRGAQLGCEITAVTITGGGRENSYQMAGGGWNVPKQDLLAGVQLLLERGELRIAKQMREAALLVKELRDMRVMVGSGGRVRMGAEGTGEHDDLVIALALGCWRAQRRRLEFGTRRLI